MKRCARCDWEYPNFLLHPIHGDTLQKGEICAICAREIRKAVYGGDMPFAKGSIAQRHEKEAISWRRDNRVSRPRVVSSE